MGDLRQFGLAPALASLLVVPAFAQDTSADAEGPARTEEVLEEVLVRGQRLSELEFDIRAYVREFVLEVSAPVRGRGHARWHRRVCIGVHNLENTHAQYIVDRVSALAEDVGLEAGEPGCEPHVNIVFSTNARETAALMVESQPRLFRPVGGHAGADLGLEALEAFRTSERAVRWWHVSLPVDARTGAPAIETASSNCPRMHCYPEVAVAGPSRVYSGIRDDLKYAIIVVDSAKLSGTTWQQLADYLAVVSLAQIDPNTDPAAFDSILNLFSNPAAYSGLTDWDRSYVEALYEFNQERDPRVQGNEIVSRIARRERAAAAQGQ